MTGNILTLILAYLVGSFPTALIVSRLISGVDIREIGDGNMGALNVSRTLGWKPGFVVAIIDFSKGALAVVFAKVFGLSLEWQLLAGIFAVIGHDFPIFAGFRGGQGMAAILGMLFILMPKETFWGLTVFVLVYLLWRNFDLSAGFGLGLLVFLAWVDRQIPIFIVYAVVLFLSIPAKKILDLPRRVKLRKQREAKFLSEEPSPLDEVGWGEDLPYHKNGNATS